jgi:hypothetical protein
MAVIRRDFREFGIAATMDIRPKGTCGQGRATLMTSLRTTVFGRQRLFGWVQDPSMPASRLAQSISDRRPEPTPGRRLRHNHIQSQPIQPPPFPSAFSGLARPPAPVNPFRLLGGKGGSGKSEWEYPFNLRTCAIFLTKGALENRSRRGSESGTFCLKSLPDPQFLGVYSLSPEIGLCLHKGFPFRVKAILRIIGKKHVGASIRLDHQTCGK